MKEIDLAQSIHMAAKASREHGKNANWPMCMICLRGVDWARIEAVSNKACEIRGGCHGQEEAMRVRFPEGISPSSNADDILADPTAGWAIKRALNDALFFRADHIESTSKKLSQAAAEAKPNVSTGGIILS